MIPAIISENIGFHNINLDESISRLKGAKTYSDLSTIIICPTRGLIPDRVVQSWMSLIKPMNQKVYGPLFIRGYEVGEAYNIAIKSILDNEELSNWKYIMTIEEDNVLPPMALMKMYENIDKYDVVGGLYWTKGEGGQPMIYGDCSDDVLNFRPQVPIPDTIQECNGLGMGCDLFKLDIFKKMPYPWFKTCNGEEGKLYTQDLYFFENAKKAGFRMACDTRVRVGHYDINTDITW